MTLADSLSAAAQSGIQETPDTNPETPVTADVNVQPENEPRVAEEVQAEETMIHIMEKKLAGQDKLFQQRLNQFDRQAKEVLGQIQEVAARISDTRSSYGVDEEGDWEDPSAKLLRKWQEKEQADASDAQAKQLFDQACEVVNDEAGRFAQEFGDVDAAVFAAKAKELADAGMLAPILLQHPATAASAFWMIANAIRADKAKDVQPKAKPSTPTPRASAPAMSNVADIKREAGESLGAFISRRQAGK